MKEWPYLIVLALLIAMVLAQMNVKRRRAMVQHQNELDERRRQGAIRAGSEVMTTSGLYGTVVALHDDETVTLSIAPGVEVKWALAALHEESDLPDRYRRGVHDNEPQTIADGATQVDRSA